MMTNSARHCASGTTTATTTIITARILPLIYFMLVVLSSWNGGRVQGMIQIIECDSLCPDGSKVPDKHTVVNDAFLLSALGLPEKESKSISCGKLEDFVEKKGRDERSVYECSMIQLVGIFHCGCPLRDSGNQDKVYKPPTGNGRAGCTMCRNGRSSVTPDKPVGSLVLPATLGGGLVNLNDCGEAEWWAVAHNNGVSCRAYQSTAGAYCGCRNPPEVWCNPCPLNQVLKVTNVMLNDSGKTCAQQVYEMSANVNICTAMMQNNLTQESCCETPPPPVGSGAAVSNDLDEMLKEKFEDEEVLLQDPASVSASDAVNFDDEEDTATEEPPDTNEALNDVTMELPEFDMDEVEESALRDRFEEIDNEEKKEDSTKSSEEEEEKDEELDSEESSTQQEKAGKNSNKKSSNLRKGAKKSSSKGKKSKEKSKSKNKSDSYDDESEDDGGNKDDIFQILSKAPKIKGDKMGGKRR